MENVFEMENVFQWCFWWLVVVRTKNKETKLNKKIKWERVEKFIHSYTSPHWIITVNGDINANCLFCILNCLQCIWLIVWTNHTREKWHKKKKESGNTSDKKQYLSIDVMRMRIYELWVGGRKSHKKFTNEFGQAQHNGDWLLSFLCRQMVRTFSDNFNSSENCLFFEELAMNLLDRWNKMITF